MPRLFSGIELPEDIQDDLGELQMPLPGARWVDLDNLHITLRFAGDIDNRTGRDFQDFLSAIEGDVFQIKLKGVGSFGPKEPKAIWAGVEPSPQLEALARANERAARNAGLPAERRKFRPHVTLARLSHSPGPAIARFLARQARFETEPFLVTHFSLFSSKPNTGGAPYIVEETFPLSGAGPMPDLHTDRFA